MSGNPTTQELACRPGQQALDKYPLVVERDRSVRGSLTFLGPARDVVNLHLVRTIKLFASLAWQVPDMIQYFSFSFGGLGRLAGGTIPFSRR